MKYFLFTISLLVALSSSAQDCTDESLLQKPGTWKESSNALSGITTTDLAREKKVVAAIHTMIKSKYMPMGVNARFNGGYTRPEPNMQGNGYSYSCLLYTSPSPRDGLLSRMPSSA